MRFLCPVVRLFGFAAKTGVAVFLLLTPAVAEDTLVVTVDQARLLKLPSDVRTLIIGNPMIADVTLLKQSGTMVVAGNGFSKANFIEFDADNNSLKPESVPAKLFVITGKGFGETNLIALDGEGKTVRNYMIRVVGGGNALVVQRGMDRESYTCAPRCQPTARLGDDPKFYGDVTAQIRAHDAQATAH